MSDLVNEYRIVYKSSTGSVREMNSAFAELARAATAVSDLQEAGLDAWLETRIVSEWTRQPV